jgi:lipoprotein-anchoring transpeptidase ErfK/SrfK
VARTIALVVGGVLAVGGIATGIVVQGRGGEEKTAPPPPAPVVPPRLERVQGLAARVPAGRRIRLRARPDGRVLALVGASTQFGSPQTFAVAFRKGDWVAVRSSVLGNTKVGWVEADSLRLVRRRLRIDVDLSERKLTVVFRKGGVKAGRVVPAVMEVSVAVGAPDTPTPPGEFYVTDKLVGADFGPYYGCCILALSGRQPRLPQGWSGGDRLAIHGSANPDWGQAVTNGCLHLPGYVLRTLMRIVPLGTAVQIHA